MQDTNTPNTPNTQNRYILCIDGDMVGEFPTIESVLNRLREYYVDDGAMTAAIDEVVPGKRCSIPVEYQDATGETHSYTDEILVLDRNSDEWRRFQEDLQAVTTITDNLKAKLHGLATTQIAGSSVESDWFIRCDVNDVVTQLVKSLPKWMSSGITC